MGPALARMDVALVPAPELGVRRLPPVVVLGDEPVRSELAAGLVAAGIDAVVGDAAVAERGAVLVLLTGDDATVRGAFQAARTARLDAQGAFVVITRMGGDFALKGVEDPTLTALYGLTKTVALEHPEALVRAIDTSSDTSVEQVLAELGRAAPTEIGLRDTNRSTTAGVMLPSPTAVLKLDANDLIVVSGGARGVTAACVIELAVRTQARFVLLGRSRIDTSEPPEAMQAATEPELMRALARSAASPAALRKDVAAILAAREARATLAAVEASGGHAVYVPVDVTDVAAVAAALAPIRAQWGPITGLVHGAGVIHDRRVKEKTDAQWDAVWTTKIGGARALLAATAADPLRVLCFFSSVAARTGNVGQADYAAANELLNRLAASESRRRPGCVVRSIGWGPWDGGMVTPGLARAFHARGIALIPLLAGARAFVDELGGTGPTEVVIGGLLAGDGAGPSLRRVNARDYGFLRDHSVAGSPVVPMVLALEWFAQRARELRPTAYVQAVEKVAVLKGITLREFEGAGDVIELHTAATRADGYSLELRSPGGPVHYRADVRMGDAPPRAPTAPGAGSQGGYPHDAAAIYARLMFHGPEFQVIRDIVSLEHDGAEADLSGAAPYSWATEGWLTDVASCDGAVQLAVLWSRLRFGGASLPTGIGAMVPYGCPVSGPVRAVLRGQRSEGKRTVSNVSLVDVAGRVYAELLGLEMHALPAGEYPGKSG